MPQVEHYDVLVLGTGEGGKSIAWHTAKSGLRTAAVERRWIGGGCPNTNCLPSKNVVWSAKVADLFHHGGEYGQSSPSTPIDMAKVRKRKRDMVTSLVAMHVDKFKNSGAELIMGNGKFIGNKTLEVTLNDGGTRLFTADKIFLNTGTHAAIPAVPGLAQAKPLTHIEILELDRLPAHLVVIGGGYVGLEFAQAYRRFGSKVTVIDHGPRLLGREDTDVSDTLRKILENSGIVIYSSAQVLSVEGNSGEKVSLKIATPQGEKVIEATDLLAAAGRVPNTVGIGLDSVGVQLDSRGYIKVNDRLETTAPNIWALGECAGSPQFTHIAYDDFRTIKFNLAGENRSTRDRLVPYCLFTDPPLARVGVNESEAKKLGIAVRVVTLPMMAVLRTRTTGETTGFMKALIGADDRILGFTMIGPEAGEVMGVVQTAMMAGSPYTLLRDAIFTHPTMAEGLNSLFSLVPAV